MLVVDLTRYLPGAFASRELLRLGARVVRVEAPEGDPMRRTAPAWDAALRRGKESVVCDLKLDPSFARALCARADVVLEGFRPGVADRLGVGPEDVPAGVVYCSITGFGTHGRHAGRVGHDLNYLGWAGALADTAPAHAPGAGRGPRRGGPAGGDRGARGARRRERDSGEGARLVVSMTHGAHELVAHRLGGDPLPRLLTGGLACYADVRDRGRPLPDARRARAAFFAPRVRALGAAGARGTGSTSRGPGGAASELAGVFARRTLADWLALFDGEDACIGPVATLAEAHADLGPWPAPLPDVPLGAHTDAWRRSWSALGYGQRPHAARSDAFRDVRRDGRGSATGPLCDPDCESRARPGSASSVSIRSRSSSWRPSRSSRIARIPSARAPSMSSA